LRQTAGAKAFLPNEAICEIAQLPAAEQVKEK
jgi:hypothetical protein